MQKKKGDKIQGRAHFKGRRKEVWGKWRAKWGVGRGTTPINGDINQT